MMTLVVGWSRLMARVTARPSRSGMRTSVSTKSDCRRRQSSCASAPLAASPTTSRSGSPTIMVRRPARASSWSSTITMRTRRACRSFFMWTPIHWRPQRDLRDHAGADAEITLHGAPPPEQGDAFPHPEQPDALSPPARPPGGPGREAAAPVLHLEANGPPVGLERDPGPAGVRVLAQVGQCLLGHPIERRLDGGW